MRAISSWVEYLTQCRRTCDKIKQNLVINFKTNLSFHYKLTISVNVTAKRNKTTNAAFEIFLTGKQG